MDELKADKLKNQLAAARSIIAATGKSPRQIGEESLRKILEWEYKWGYSSSALGQLLLDRTSGGYMQKLTKKNWLTSTRTKSGAPAAYYTLSELGLQEAERHSDTLFKYIEIDQYKVDQSKIRHYLIAQQATIQALKSGLIVDYETERMFQKDGDKLGIKRPDIVWITPGGLRYGVEVELSAKWEKDLDMFIIGILRALQSGGNDKLGYSRFIIFSDSGAIIRRYTAAMQPSAPLSLWKKNERGHWAIERTVKVPDWLINKVDFKLIEG